MSMSGLDSLIFNLLSALLKYINIKIYLWLLLQFLIHIHSDLCVQQRSAISSLHILLP